MKIQLVDDWRQAWKMASMWVYAILIALPQIVPLIDAETRAGMPEWLGNTISLLAFAGMAARLVRQEYVKLPKEPPQ